MQTLPIGTGGLWLALPLGWTWLLSAPGSQAPPLALGWQELASTLGWGSETGSGPQLEPQLEPPLGPQLEPQLAQRSEPQLAQGSEPQLGLELGVASLAQASEPKLGAQ